MNVVFAGYRKWSYQILKRLLKQNNSSFTISGVITIEKPEANFTNLPIPSLVIDPTKINDITISKKIKQLKPNIFLFYGWSWYIPEDYFTKYLCLILHTSPLPKYRGGSPLQHQIINGEKNSAASIISTAPGLDEGLIYSQSPFSLKGTMDDIFKRIVTVGTKDTITVLEGIAKKTLQPTPQDEKLKTVFKRRKPRDSELTPKDFQEKTAEELYNFIRALGSPYPNAYIVCKDGKKLYFTGAKIDKKD